MDDTLTIYFSTDPTLAHNHVILDKSNIWASKVSHKLRYLPVHTNYCMYHQSKATWLVPLWTSTSWTWTYLSFRLTNKPISAFRWIILGHVSKCSSIRKYSTVYRTGYCLYWFYRQRMHRRPYPTGIIEVLQNMFLAVLMSSDCVQGSDVELYRMNTVGGSAGFERLKSHGSRITSMRCVLCLLREFSF